MLSSRSAPLSPGVQTRLGLRPVGILTGSRASLTRYNQNLDMTAVDLQDRIVVPQNKVVAKIKSFE